MRPCAATPVRMPLLRLLHAETMNGRFGRVGWRLTASESIHHDECAYSIPRGAFGATPNKVRGIMDARRQVKNGNMVFAWSAAGVPSFWEIAVSNTGPSNKLRLSGRIRVSDEKLFSNAFSPIAAQYGFYSVGQLIEDFGQQVDVWVKAFLPQLENGSAATANPGFDPALWTKRFEDGAAVLPFASHGLSFEVIKVDVVARSSCDSNKSNGRKLLDACSQKASEDAGTVTIEKVFARSGRKCEDIPLAYPAVRSGESLGFDLKSSKSGFVTLLTVDEEEEIDSLLPSGSIPCPSIKAGSKVPVGGPDSPWIVDLRESGLPGERDALVAIVSDRPLLSVSDRLEPGTLKPTVSERLLNELQNLDYDAWSADTLEFDIV